MSRLLQAIVKLLERRSKQKRYDMPSQARASSRCAGVALKVIESPPVSGDRAVV